MKKLLLFLLLSFFIQQAQCAEVLKGTMVRLYSKKPISTEFYQEGDFVYFTNPSDVWIGEENVFPTNTIFTGYISALKLPIQGVNGAMWIKLTGIYFPDGRKERINARLFINGSDKIGGTLTPPATYNTSIHYWKGWQRGVQQFVPSGEYEFGKHTTIPTNEPVYAVFDENFITGN